MEPDLFSKYACIEKVVTHSEYDYIYISPHLDDVPLSCGGTICQQKTQGFNILVVTVFAGDPQPPFSPFVQSSHHSWQASKENPYKVRKMEGRKAMAVLDVDYLLRTVGAHLASIYTKLGVDSRASAVAMALERGLLDHDRRGQK